MVGGSTGELQTRSQIVDGVVILFLFFPESEVLLEELDDTLSVTEVILLKLVNLIKGILQSLICEADSLLGVLVGLVIEYGEVEGEP